MNKKLLLTMLAKAAVSYASKNTQLIEHDKTRQNVELGLNIAGVLLTGLGAYQTAKAVNVPAQMPVEPIIGELK